jgi:hypothetical protein
VVVQWKFPKLKLSGWRSSNARATSRTPVTFTGAVNFQRRREQERKLQRRRDLSESWQSRKLLVLSVAALAVCGIFTLAGLQILRANPQNKVDKIVVRGATAATPEQVVEAISWVRQQNLFAVNLNSVRSDLLNKFPYFRDVFIRKIHPNKLEIEVIERFPVLTYANLATSITLDEEGKVIGIFADEQTQPLSVDEINIIQGFGDVNSFMVEEKYLASLPDDRARARVKWDEVKPEDKRVALEALRQEIVNNKVNTPIKARADKLGEQLLKDLPQLQDLTVDQFKLGDSFPTDKFEFAYDLHKYFQARKRVVTRMLWLTDFNIVVTLSTASNTRIIFTTSRPLAQQIAAVESISRVEDLSKVGVIDVRSDVVSVR